MRIDLHCGPHQVSGKEAASRSQSNASAIDTASSAKIGQDEAAFSAEHVQVQALAAEAAQLPEIRKEKVEALREAITSGRYRADPEDVAGALMSDITLARSA
ncbi:MAG TPA: flagellar biosynthesis anti-sigma factor FlgM [Candidatus Sulfotelmatobacter sp.]|nr:flagellar biosynthesis anti-sigma factor FlgM [Candidatus Sulfotelmatobacter sp.]